MQLNSVKAQKIALVGGGGFIGHNLALALNKLGAEVDIIDSLQVNNLYSFGKVSPDVLHRDLYLKIIKSLSSNLRYIPRLSAS